MTKEAKEFADRFFRVIEQMSEEDRQKLDRVPVEKSPKPKAKSISLGWAKPDDPIYTGAGWNFVMGKNLNPRIKPNEK